MKNLIFILCFILISTQVIFSQDSSVEKTFYKAVYAEQIDGDLEKARSLYEQISKSKDADRLMIAKSLYRLGLITEKEGAEKALVYYTRVVEQFPDYKDLIELVRNRVDKLEDANTFIDPRDGHKYKWVKIGNQIWMAENLAYMPWVNPVKKQENGIWVYDYDSDNVAEAKATENYQKYGCLYDWATAMGVNSDYLVKKWEGDTINHQGICPPNWHIPTDSEWMELEIALGMPIEEAKGEGFNRAGLVYSKGYRFDLPPIGRYLKSSEGWNSDSDGDNSSNFNAYPAGTRSSSELGNKPKFNSLGMWTSFWTTSQTSDTARNGKIFESVYSRDIGISRPDDIYKSTYNGKMDGLSLRCVKNFNNEYDLIAIDTSHIEEFTTPVPRSTELDGIPEPEIIWKSNKPLGARHLVRVEDYLVFCSNDSIMRLEPNSSRTELLVRAPHRITYPIKYYMNNVYVISGRELMCYNTTTWQVVWSFKTQGGQGHFGISNGKIIYLNSTIGNRNKEIPSKIICLNSESGTVDWEISLQYNFASYPAFYNEMFYFTTANLGSSGDRNYCFAYNINSGEKVWEYILGDSGLSDPILLDEKLIFGCTDEYVHCLNAISGEKLWKCFIGYRMYGDPLIYNGKVYIGDLGNWLSEPPIDASYYAINANSGEIVWNNNNIPEARFHEGSVGFDNTIVTSATKAGLIAFDSETGDILWRLKTGVSFPPIVMDDIIVFSAGEYFYGIKPPKE